MEGFMRIIWLVNLQVSSSASDAPPPAVAPPTEHASLANYAI